MAGPLGWHWARLQAFSHQTLLQVVPVTKHSSKQHHNWPWHHNISHRNVLFQHCYWSMLNVCVNTVIDIWQMSIFWWVHEAVFFLPHIWAKGVVHPSYVLLLGGSGCLLNYQCCSETQSRRCHYGWQNNMLKSHVSVQNEKKKQIIWLIYCTTQETTKTLNLLEMFRAVQAAECCQSGQGLLDL